MRLISKARSRLPAFAVAVILSCAASAAPAGAVLPRTGLWGKPGQPVISPDGRFMYVADRVTTLVLARNPASGELKLIDAIEADGYRTATLSPDGSFLYEVGERGVRILRRSPTSGSLIASGAWTSNLSSVSDFTLSADGRYAYATISPEGALLVLRRDPASGSLTQVSAVAGSLPTVPEGLALAGPGEDTLYSNSYSTIGQYAARL